MNVRAFLAEIPPFDALDSATLDAVSRSVEVAFFPQGSTILEQGGEPAAFLHVVRKGDVEMRDAGRPVDEAGPGEVFGELSLVSGSPPTASVVAREDTICYLVPRETAMAALGGGPGLGFVQASLRRRVLRGASALQPARVHVGALIRRPPVTCHPATTVAEAAARMASEGVSSLLVEDARGWGILTDRDLRSRVLAVGRDGSTPVGEVMSFPARSVEPDATAEEVLRFMLEGGFHHAPVADPTRGVLGVVSDSDLMGLERRSPFALRARIDRAPDVAAAVEAARELPWTIVALVESNVDPVDVGHVTGVAVDALVHRLIDLAVAEVGDPPVPWAWIGLGSAARHEQAMRSDQDHALAFDPQGHAVDEIDPYFAALAERVTAGLEAAGFARCAGNVMATNAALRLPVTGWQAALDRWMADLGMEGSVATSIVFDFRRVAGPLDIEPVLDDLVRRGPARHPQFIVHLGRRALDRDPPTGFIRDFVVESSGEHAGRLDVKHGGITLVSNLARFHAIRAGLAEKRTIDRLQAAAGTDGLWAESALALEEAFRLLWDVRLEHQAAQVRSGEPPDDFVDPKALGSVARAGLKEAFRTIAREQRVVGLEVGAR